jgi:hypothetical protein
VRYLCLELPGNLHDHERHIIVEMLAAMETNNRSTDILEDLL